MGMEFGDRDVWADDSGIGGDGFGVEVPGPGEVVTSATRQEAVASDAGIVANGEVRVIHSEESDENNDGVPSDVA